MNSSAFASTMSSASSIGRSTAAGFPRFVTTYAAPPSTSSMTCDAAAFNSLIPISAISSSGSHSGDYSIIMHHGMNPLQQGLAPVTGHGPTRSRSVLSASGSKYTEPGSRCGEGTQLHSGQAGASIRWTPPPFNPDPDLVTFLERGTKQDQRRSGRKQNPASRSNAEAIGNSDRGSGAWSLSPVLVPSPCVGA